ncbi:MAG: hypothetical protein U5Q03_02645 [Bacteroidota bacterium]|nr:hypothetical protein [Bacteroidota bacterium]
MIINTISDVIFLGKHLQVLNFINRRLRDSNWFVVYNDRYNIIFVENNAENNHIIRNDLIRKRNLEIMPGSSLKSGSEACLEVVVGVVTLHIMFLLLFLCCLVLPV